MADLTSSDVVVDDTWDVGTRTGKQKMVAKMVTISTGTAGGTTNQMPATAFGFSKVHTVQILGVDNADPGNYIFQPSWDGTDIIAVNLEQATDANRGDPADVAFETFPTKLLIQGVL